MRGKGLTIAGLLFAALPVLAQDNIQNTQFIAKDGDRTSTVRSKGAGFRIMHVNSATWLGVPDAPQPPGFPAGDKSKGSEEAPGRLVPRFELSGGFSYVNLNPGSPFDSFSNYGATGEFAYNASRYLGLVAELNGYDFSRNVNGSSVKGSWTSWLFGPRLNMRRFDYFVPFAEFLLGGGHAGTQVTGDSEQNAFAIAAGGGVDVVLGKHVAWRFAQIDYLMTNFSGSALGGNGRQDNLRVGTGIVLRWGLPAPPPPPKPKEPPTASCALTPASVYAGSNDTVAVHVTANSPDNLPLTYSYTATGGTVEGTGADARWNSSGANTGSYTVTAKVDDGKGGTASCTADVRVEERPHHPPTVSVSANPTTIKVGESSTISCNATSPDNLPLTYNYSASGGTVTGNGPQAQFNSSGVTPGNYSTRCEVTDSRGDKGDGSANVEVQQPPPPPEQVRLEQRLALHSVYFPTAQPTEANPQGGLTASQKQTLDTLAVDFKSYLTYKPDAHLILGGHADVRGSKEYNDKLSERRVERARSYLVDKGVPADHIELKAYGFEKNMTDQDVKGLVEQDTTLTPAEKQRILRNLVTVRLAQNRRVDVTLSTTGEQSVRQFPFNAKDALTLLSRSGGQTKKAPATAPKKKPTP